MQNYEYKAELRDIDLARTICKALRATYVGRLEQVDTYYNVPDARLKRRETIGHATEYILYHRANRAAPRLSNYTIYSEKQAKERFGEQPLPVLVVVRKTRELYLVSSVRIHLDEVEGLGRFIELEAVLANDRTMAEARTALERVRKALSPAMGEAIAVGYSDLLRDLG